MMMMMMVMMMEEISLESLSISMKTSIHRLIIRIFFAAPALKRNFARQFFNFSNLSPLTFPLLISICLSSLRIDQWS
jgi:hypothetical protein